MKIVLVTGGFDPLHSGHLNYFTAAKALGDKRIVGVNSDAWLTRKKGRPFLPCLERLLILQNLKMIDQVITFNDDDGSARDAIQRVNDMYPYKHHLIFANGGDRTPDNIPEYDFPDVEFVFGVGGDQKQNSSSWILDDWKKPKTIRPWGEYRVLHEHAQSVKVKELTVQPGQSLSMQRHSNRGEHWLVAEGVATVYTINRKSDIETLGKYGKWQHIHIVKGEWHQLCNESTELLKLIEIQYGTTCVEDDIERKC